MSYEHYPVGKDSIVLKEQTDFPYFGKIEIYRKGNKIFNYSEKNLEIEGYPYQVCTEYDSVNSHWFYIFKYSDRPAPNKYLIVKGNLKEIKLIGITKNSSADILGDIDYDGFIELGGLSEYTDSKTNFKKDYKIIKIKEGFPEDTILTKLFVNKIIKIR